MDRLTKQLNAEPSKQTPQPNAKNNRLAPLGSKSYNTIPAKPLPSSVQKLPSVKVAADRSRSVMQND